MFSSIYNSKHISHNGIEIHSMNNFNSRNYEGIRLNAGQKFKSRVIYSEEIVKNQGLFQK